MSPIVYCSRNRTIIQNTFHICTSIDYKKKLAQQISLNERLHGEVNGLKEDVSRLSRESSSQSLMKVDSGLGGTVYVLCFNSKK